MSTPRLLLRPPRVFPSSLRPRPHHQQYQHQQPQPQPQLSPPRRSFISTPKTVRAKRRLPYDHQRLYEIIADVDSYVRFLPYCKESRVTRWTDPIPNHSSSSSPPPTSSPPPRRWPAEAYLTTGWGGLEETYTSRIFCVPSLGIVEAISGDARTEIPYPELVRHGLLDPAADAQASQRPGVFKSLVTRWTVEPAEAAVRDDRFQRPWSNVNLSVRYEFVNPLYTAFTSALEDRVVAAMVEAFEKRAESVLKETRSDPGAAR
ncbi:dehydrase and lipid transport-domain-containing protein [Daldinia caldariorum]|uniref:dehydrase and lipid transport-domain-containing protein n=1 Tax=Daldinia caldariorum TaxID=326644 RepID=UPI0020079988|nr:dehydrase and lipid transport-domain-containing protein [Daldinia caldariorum]KAI1468462.1 dehydrase and lipid transport-domain-containing protein [Daldinia caldariorum]